VDERALLTVMGFVLAAKGSGGDDQALTAIGTVLAAIAAFASVVVAIVAYQFSVASFDRQQCRADAQQRRAEKLAVDSVKPLLWIAGQDYVGMKSVQVRNHGLGPAIIKSACFKKLGNPSSNLVELFTGLGSASWVTYADLPPKLVIPAGSHLVLIEQSLDNLLKQGKSEKEAFTLLASIQRRKLGIKVVIRYFDIFGNEMTPVEFTIGPNT
jgi:hypothetical protein